MHLVIFALAELDYSQINTFLRSKKIECALVFYTDSANFDAASICCNETRKFLLSREDLLETATDTFFEWIDFIRTAAGRTEDPMLGKVRLLGHSVINFTRFSQKKSSKTPIHNIFQYKAALSEYEKYLDKETKNKVTGVLFNGNPVIARALQESISCIFPNAYLYPQKTDRAKSIKQQWKKVFKYCRNYISLVGTLWRLKKLKLQSNGNLAIESLADKVVITTDDWWHIRSSGSDIESTYWPELTAQMKARSINIEWGFILDPRDLTSINSDLRSKVEASLVKQDPGLSGLFSLTIKLFRLLLRYIYSRRGIVRVLQKADAYAGLTLSELAIDDLDSVIVNSSEYIFTSLRIVALVESISPIAILERKPFNTFGKLVILSIQGQSRVLGIQHGVVNDKQIGYQFSKIELDSNLNTNAMNLIPSKMLVFGERVYRKLVYSNFPKERVSIIGNLKYGSLIQNLAAVDLSSESGSPKVLLVALQSGVSETNLMATVVASAIKEYAYMSIVIRGHPNHLDMVNYAFEVLVAQGIEKKRISISKDSNVFSALASVDCVLCHSSTLIFDSLLSNVPVILLAGCGNENDNRLFQGSGCFRSFSTADELKEILSSGILINNESKCIDLIRKNFASEGNPFDLLAKELHQVD